MTRPASVAARRPRRPPSRSDSQRPILSRREWAVVLALVLVGILCRIAWPSGMAVEHFDEGVYASNLWFGPELGFHYPQLHLYAPPLLSALIEAALVLDLSIFPGAVPHRLTPMVPSLLAGGATLLLLWWGVRRWFGSAIAVAALACGALSDFHILYSRTALTDVLLLFWLFAAIFLFERAVSFKQALHGLFAGAAASAAWWTKYNGWLALAIPLGSTLVLPALVRNAGFVRAIVRWTAIAAVAAVAWSPVVWQLQTTGGYAAVAANHRQYLVGWRQWWPGLVRQAENLAWWDSGLTAAGLALAALLPVWLTRRPDRAVWLAGLAVAALLAAGVAWGGSGLVLLLLGGLGLVRSWRLLTAPSSLPDGPWATALVAVWFLGLLAMTPWYYPYPRLVLPWLGASWIAAGLTIDGAVRTLSELVQRRRWMIGVCSVVGVAALASAAAPLAGKAISAWQPRTSLAEAAAQIVRDTHNSDAADGDALYFVYGEPALYYHLRAAGRPLVIPVADLEFVDQLPAAAPQAFLLTGLHADRSPEFDVQWRAHAARFQHRASYAYRPSDLVLLNQASPKELRRMAERPEYAVRLYGVRARRPAAAADARPRAAVPR